MSFIDEYGEEEPGIDGGGLYREFLQILQSEFTSQEHSIFIV